MLQHTFCHIPNIGLKKERSFWHAGVRRWADVVPDRLSPRRRDEFLQTLDASQHALAAGDAAWFAQRLTPCQHWRLFNGFCAPGSVAYVDIETTGMMGHPGDHITTIALYDGETVRTYVHGRNLDDFPRDVADYKLLVTYNGKCFDVPYINSYFGVELTQAHLDLRYVLHRLGFKGGLKGCEKQLGLARGDTEGIDGYFAVLLWREFKRTRDERCLETLLAYNVDDVLSLECLMQIAWNRCVAETPFAEALTRVESAKRDNPHEADRETVDRIKTRWLSPAWG